jgi:hypothetical protein
MVSEFRQAQMFIRTLPAGRHLFTSRNTQGSTNNKEQNADWFFAIGSYSRWGKGEARISVNNFGRHYDVDFEYCISDRYNWDTGKGVTIAGVMITDEFMGEFHRQGLAREFDCRGSVRRRLIWDGDFGAPDQSIILKRQERR